MELAVRNEGAVTIVRPEETRLDAMAAVMFKDRMKTVMEAAGPRIVLDLSAVGFLDSSGLGAVVAAQRFLRAGQAMELAGLTGAVERVFRLTRMDRMFTIHIRVDDALRATA